MDRMAKLREARARPTCRLYCPTGEHGIGVLLYIPAKNVKGWCWCGKVLRPASPAGVLLSGVMVEAP